MHETRAISDHLDLNVCAIELGVIQRCESRARVLLFYEMLWHRTDKRGAAG